MATPMVQTQQNSPVDDLQKWLPILATILQNKAANRLAQKNEMGQLIQSKMKQMESGFTADDEEQLKLMMSGYSRMKTSYGMGDMFKGLVGMGQPDMTQFINPNPQTATPKVQTQTMETSVPTVPPMTTSTVSEKPVPQDALQATGEQAPTQQPIAGVQPRATYEENYQMALQRNLAGLQRGGQPIIGGKRYEEAIKDAREYAQAVEMIKERSAITGETNTRKQTQEYSMAYFGKPWEQLDGKQKQFVLQTAAAQEAQFRTAGGIEAGLDKPLTDNDLLNFVNPATGSTFPAGTTMRDVRRAGAVATTPQQREALGKLDTVSNTIDTLAGLADRLITADNGIAAQAQGATLFAAAKTGLNETARTYNAERNAFLGNISRELGGERGVLTDRDIERVSNSLPAFNDTRKVKDFKINMLRMLVDTAKDAKKRAMFGGGFNQTAYRNKIESMLNSLDASSAEEAVDTTKPPAGFTQRVTNKNGVTGYMNPATGQVWTP